MLGLGHLISKIINNVFDCYLTGNRSQIIQSECKQVTNAKRSVPELNDNEAWRGAGTGFSAGRGKTIQKTSCPDTNIQPSTAGGGLNNGKGRRSYPNRGKTFTQRVSSYDSYNTRSRFQPSPAANDSSSGPSYVAQRWSGEPSKSNQASWKRNEQQRALNTNQSGSTSNTEKQMRNRGWWPPTNAPSTNQGHVPVSFSRGSPETPSIAPKQENPVQERSGW